MNERSQRRPQVSVRLGGELREAVERRARQECRSVSNCIAAIVAAAVDQDQGAAARPKPSTPPSPLIALVSDAKACARRLAELKTTMDEIEKAQATLDAHRSAVAADKASGDAREKALRDPTG